MADVVNSLGFNVDSNTMKEWWRDLLRAYVIGYDLESVPLCHSEIQNGYWQTLPNTTINRLDRWGNEWLMGLAVGLVHLVHSETVSSISTGWHMLQLSLQNVIQPYIENIDRLC